MVRTIKNVLSFGFNNLSGWSTKRKIIVFESDDWGSIRMPSRKIFEKALDNGYRVDLNEYEKFDTILSELDLKYLFQVLSSFRDFRGRFPVITANCVVANPDFNKIENTEFSEYFYESILETFTRYFGNSNVFSYWQQGKDEGLLQFQYHAREHVNVSLFMNALRLGDPDIVWGFNQKMAGIIKKGGVIRYPNPYVEATRFSDFEDMKSKMDIYFHGLNMFKELFGYSSKTVIPTNYLWNCDYNWKLLQEDVIALQGVRKLVNPILTNQNPNIRALGQSRDSAIINLVRNNRLEPSLSKNKSYEFRRCLDFIGYAFQLRKPSIISIHRVNFAGGIFPENRNENLAFFFEFLTNVLKKWPDVEFMSSDQLAVEILGNASDS